MIELAPGLNLPDSAATNSYALLGMKGAGKSNAAVVFAEELFAASVPWVAIDPKGDWWGIRSMANGKVGLPVPIFGGLHADVPIDQASGASFAELIVDRHLTCLIDVSEFSKAESIRFLTAFFERLYRLKNRATYPMHLILEECDDYVPQMVRSDIAGLVRNVELCVKRGRQRGLGITLATQRSASVNKDVLTQTDTLIALRTTGPQDRKAIKAWIDYHAGAQEIIDELPTLRDGEAWVSSPAQLRILKKVRFRRRLTFDSGATPELGEKVKPATLADIDVEAIIATMGALLEKAKADDPKLLRAKIKGLEGQRDRLLQDLKSAPAIVQVTTEVVPASVVDALRGTLTAYDELLEGFGRARRHLADRLDEVEKQKSVSRPAGNGDKRRVRAGPAPTVAQPAPARTPPEYGTKGAFAATLDGPLGKMERKILAVLAQHPDGRTNTQLTTLTGYRYSGGFKNALSALRTAGLIVGGNTATMQITDAGLALDDWDPLPTGPALLDWWNENQLSGMERPMLEYLLKIHPESITGEELAAATDYAYSGGFKNALSKLRTLAIIEGGNMTGVRATDDFVEAVS